MSDFDRTDEECDRTPAACPFCQHEGVFDHQGIFEDTMTRVARGVKTEYEESWSRIHCPNCNGVFEMRDSIEEANSTRVSP